MADKRITQLNAVTTPSGSDVFAIVNNNETKKITYENVEKSIRNSVNTSSFLEPSDTGSLMITGSLSGSSLVFEKGDSSTFDIDLSESFITPSQTGSLVNTTYGLFNQTASFTGVSASIAESSLIGGGVGTLTVPANSFTQGDAYHATFSGTCQFHNGDTLRIRVKTDSTLISDTGVMTLNRADDERWNLDIDFSIHETGESGSAVLASTGVFQYTQHASDAFSGRNFGLINNTTFDTTINNQLEVTAQFDHNDNVISTEIFTLRKTY